MREDKIGDLSMELSVGILQLTKELRAKRENVISNQPRYTLNLFLR